MSQPANKRALYAVYDRDGRRVFTSAFQDFAEAHALRGGTVRKFEEVEMEGDA